GRIDLVRACPKRRADVDRPVAHSDADAVALAAEAEAVDVYRSGLVVGLEIGLFNDLAGIGHIGRVRLPDVDRVMVGNRLARGKELIFEGDRLSGYPGQR